MRLSVGGGCVAAGGRPGPEIIRSCGEAGILDLVIISAGFREAGEEGRALEGRLREEARRFDGMRMIGPNCLGIIVPYLSLNASFASGSLKLGQSPSSRSRAPSAPLSSTGRRCGARPG